jgi:zinc protease
MRNEPQRKQRKRNMQRYKVKGKRQIGFKIQKSKRLLSALVIAFAFLLFTFNFSLAATAEAKHYTELQLAPLAEIKLPKYERFVLQNGLVVYLMEDHELPLVNGTALIRTGSRVEPLEKVGLADFTGEVMRTGGTKKHSPDKLNEILEQRAAAVETNIGEATGNASFQALSEDLEMVFGLC